MNLRIALAQINPTVGDLSGNRDKILEYVREARKKKVDIVVFPELVLCGYPPEDLLYKESFVEDNLRVLRELAKEIVDVTIIIGFVDRDKKRALYNAAAVIHHGSIKGVYHKQELPNYGVFDEKRYFTRGENEKIFSFNGVLFGVNICEDIWITPSIVDRQVKKGAQVLINLSSSPFDVEKLEARETVVTKRALESKAYICYVNLVGGQDELVFDGCSFIVNPQGKIVASAKSFKEELLIADLHIKTTSKKKAFSSQVIALKSKNAEHHPAIPMVTRLHESPIERIYKALVLGTRDYVIKNGFKKVLIGLSGGIDSALVAVIASDAIGKDNVVGVSMPSRFTSEGTRSDAKILAQNLGIQFKEIPIEGVFVSYLKSLESEFAGLESNNAEENIQARIRGNILMALSNKFGWLVLTTGNKSEVGVGYCTLYGDMSGGFAVIKDVPKTKVYELSMFRNSHGKEVIPQSIIDRAPSAELRENQKDQDSLPPYDVLDKILTEYVENHRSFKEMAKKYDENLVKKTIRLVDMSEYKRRQAAPGIKITPRAFGKDWRLPITNKYKAF